MSYARQFSNPGHMPIEPPMGSSQADLSVNPENIEAIPERVQDYVDLYLMKHPTPMGSKSQMTPLTGVEHITSVYRATNIVTNQRVCLRRVHSYQPNTGYSKSLYATIDGWKRVQSANMVRLLHVFTTKDFGDNSLILVYQYFPQVVTLMQKYFSDAQGLGSTGNSIYGFGGTNRPYSQQIAMLKNRLIPENMLWHFIIQVSSTLRMIHTQGLACRSLDPSKVIMTTILPKCPPSQLQPSQYPRLRLNAPGLYDIVLHDKTLQDHGADMKAHYQELQQDDLVAFGRLCLALATSSFANSRDEQWDTGLDLVGRTYSNDLKILIVTLLTSKQQEHKRTINEIMPMIGARFYAQLNLSYELYDNSQIEAEQEALNGKLFRLLVKLSMINDRPELRMDASWSETGDRYMLKLFKEYLFHQVTEDGNPWLDLAHIVSTLIKFDTGCPEKICLISRDEQHVLVVSFAELKKCFENSYNQLQT